VCVTSSCEGCFEDWLGCSITGVVEEDVTGIGTCYDEVWVEGGEFRR
jgi:hypothetical protein